MSFTTDRVSEYEIKVQPEKTYLSTIESTLVVLELLNKHKIEQIDDNLLNGFLRPFKKMIEYQKNLIANPQSHAVRFKKHKT
jgi:DTW domain-containing protein YfiP